MGVPLFFTVLKWHIALVSLHVIIVVKILVGNFCAFVIELLDAREHVFVERPLTVGKGIAAERISLEVHGHFLQQTVGRGEEPEAGVVGPQPLFLAALEDHHGMRSLSAVAGTRFLKINGFCHKSATNRLVGCLVYILDIITMCFLHTLEFPLGNDFAAVPSGIGNRALEHCSLAAVGIYHALLVGHFPIIVGRTVALADDA